MAIPLSAGLLDACVLAMLKHQDLYGYALTQNVQSVAEISESTLYPVLRRLQKEGCLSTYDRPYQGRNRRYYAITPQGRERLLQARAEWERFKEHIDALLEGSEDVE
ncbi:helix-turn-helix transcriptional regulator [Beduinella massiliensis]|uniref:helix-turn-helix transcriptional regulator n=1 Tax=Beduinella massiliensis TaxID=1852363 RepID=UPI000C838B48